MNNVKNTIGWADFSWNPITGCLNGCEYCYARKIYKRFYRSFKPQFHYKRLSEPLKIKKPSRIFVCSVSDFWGNGTKQIWRDEVYNVINACPEHIFQILTKQPQNITDARKIPDNVWVGVSVTGYKDWQKPLYLAHNIENNIRFISYEPILNMASWNFEDFDWVIIGAMTGAERRKYQPKIEWIESILRLTDKYNVPVFMKNSLKSIWKKKLRQEFPL